MAGSPNQAQKTVGAVVVTGIIIFFIICILFTSGVSLESYTLYQVNMTEAVAGLSPDAEVEYNGVHVGTVKKISINRNNPNIVQLLLNIKSSTLITKDTVAMLKPKGFTGLSYISLSLRGNNLTPLEAKPGDPYPVIPTTPSYYMQIDAMVAHFDQAFTNVKASFQALLDKDNLEKMRDSYYSISFIINTFREHPGDFSAIIRNIRLSLPYFTQISFYKEAITKTVQMEMEPVMYRMLENFSNVIVTLSDTYKTIKEKPSILLTGVASPQPGPGEGRTVYRKTTFSSPAWCIPRPKPGLHNKKD